MSEMRKALTDTQVSTFKVAGAALRAPAVHGPHSAPVRRLVAGPEIENTDTKESMNINNVAGELRKDTVTCS